ncbi:MAG: hypothetical protein ACPH5P_03020 [Akkermansiaceae bacterium]
MNNERGYYGLVTGGNDIGSIAAKSMSRLLMILAIADIVMASANGEMTMELNKFIIVNLIEVHLWWQPAN